MNRDRWQFHDEHEWPDEVYRIVGNMFDLHPSGGCRTSLYGAHHRPLFTVTATALGIVQVAVYIDHRSDAAIWASRLGQ